MTNVIDLNAERERRDGPDAGCIAHDQDGRKMFKFSIGFRVGDSEFTFSIFAYDWPDAERRLQFIRETGEVTGQIYSEGML